MFRLVSLFLLLAPILAQAQISVESGFKTLPLGKDTLCFRYQFVQGDTLVYVREARDSIMFEGAPTLLKFRTEIVSVICDSVTPREEYVLSITLREALEEQFDGGDTVRRKGAPWVGRTAHLIIDSLGNRLAQWADDSTKAALTPGGAFQPLLLPTLGESCGRQNQSWMVEDTVLMVENGVPEPVFAHMALWRVMDNVDTLGRSFRQIQYTQTALASFTMTSDRVNLFTTAVIASYGKMSLDAQLLVPYHLVAVSQNNLSVKFPNGVERKGKHHTSSHSRLIDLRSHVPERRLSVAK